MQQLSVDFANYAGNLTAIQADVLDNFPLVIVRASLETWNNQRKITQQQLSTLHGRTSHQAYGWCYWYQEPRELVREWLRLLDPFDSSYYRDPVLGKILWLDAEEKPVGYDVIGWLKQAADECLRNGFTPGIYTGGWWARDYRIDFRPLSHLPLWAAEYDGIPDVNDFFAFGGWSKPWMKQYDGDTEVGISLGFVDNVDLNVFEPSPTPPAPEPEPEEDMTALQVEVFEDFKARLSDYQHAIQEFLDMLYGRVLELERQVIELGGDEATQAELDALQAQVDDIKNRLSQVGAGL